MIYTTAFYSGSATNLQKLLAVEVDKYVEPLSGQIDQLRIVPIIRSKWFVYEIRSHAPRSLVSYFETEITSSAAMKVITVLASLVYG